SGLLDESWHTGFGALLILWGDEDELEWALPPNGAGPTPFVSRTVTCAWAYAVSLALFLPFVEYRFTLYAAGVV
ncbi:MAG: hypothetical protein QOI51_1643, partial [Nocardioidaceae bacterium]|nr:hypothetical protein [Nocardioidaceae bacterium]